MIISCEKCNKKFELEDNLIPETGRLLQCGSCSYQWHYIPTNKITLLNEIDSTKSSKNIKKSLVKKIDKKKINVDKNILESSENILENKRGVGFFSYLLVIIISLVALLVIGDTFKPYLLTIVPNLDFYLSSLYESLTDIYLFFKDLLK
jgi:hypothetical protein